MFFFPKTRVFTVHRKPSDDFKLEQTIFIPEGFNIIAFIFSFIWMLYHKMWFHALLVFFIVSLLGLAEEQKWFSYATISILQVAFSFIVGFHANDWRRAQLASKGYISDDVVVSDNDTRARQRYFDRVLTA